MRVSNIRYNGDCETYQILGGEAISIDLKSGDSVEIVDVEGDQKCSVLAFDSKKSSALSSLNWNTKPKNNSNKISSGDCSEMLKAILNGKKIKSQEPKINQEPKEEDNKNLDKTDEITNKDSSQKSKNITFGKLLSYLIVSIISFIALVVLLDTLKTPLINIFPGLEKLLFNLFETLKDIKLFIIDLY